MSRKLRDNEIPDAWHSELRMFSVPQITLYAVFERLAESIIKQGYEVIGPLYDRIQSKMRLNIREQKKTVGIIDIKYHPFNEVKGDDQNNCFLRLATPNENSARGLLSLVNDKVIYLKQIPRIKSKEGEKHG